MKKMGMMFACVMLAACGGSNTRDANRPAPVRGSGPLPATETAAYETPKAAPMPPAPVVVEPAPAPVPVTVTASAELTAMKGDASLGKITFVREDAGPITIRGEFTGLKENSEHAFYIHKNGDCSKKGTKVGAHLDPTGAKHGPPASSQRHAGDLGNLTADDAGNATFAMTTDSVTIEADRPDSVLNRAIVIHTKKDDKAGNGGPALACGVIALATP